MAPYATERSPSPGHAVVCDISACLSLPSPCPLQWHALSREEQAKYYELARKERQLHMQLYPGWSARDNYVGGSSLSGLEAIQMWRMSIWTEEMQPANLNRSSYHPVCPVGTLGTLPQHQIGGFYLSLLEGSINMG